MKAKIAELLHVLKTAKAWNSMWITSSSWKPFLWRLAVQVRVDLVSLWHHRVWLHGEPPLKRPLIKLWGWACTGGGHEVECSGYHGARARATNIICTLLVHFHVHLYIVVEMLLVSSSVLARPIPKGTVTFGCSIVPFGSAKKPQCALWPLEVLEVVESAKCYMWPHSIGMGLDCLGWTT